MKKKFFNTGIVALFIYLFYLYVKATGSYTLVLPEKEKSIKEVSMKTAEVLMLDYTEHIKEKENCPVAVAEGIVKGETYEQGKAIHSVIPYYIPLDEIAEKIEYAYACDNIWEEIADQRFDELGYLPKGENISLTVYLVEGNEILFLPKGTENKKVWINHDLHRLYYSKGKEGYLFFRVTNWREEVVEELGVPVGSARDQYRITTYTVKEDYNFDTLVELGEIEVTFDPENKAEMPAVSVVQNKYIDTIVKEAQSLLAERKIYGEFKMYIGKYERVCSDYYDGTECIIAGCIIGDDIEQYFSFLISDSDGIRIMGGPDTYFPDGFGVGYNKRKVQEAERESISFSVVEGLDYTDVSLEEEYRASPVFKEGISFYSMSIEEAVEIVNYVCSYSEWFGMNELGCQIGTIRGLDHKEVIIYTSYARIYFVPKEKVNYIVQDENGKDYQFYLNDGCFEFYTIDEKMNIGKKGQLVVTMIRETEFDIGRDSVDSAAQKVMEQLIVIGEAMVEITDLPALGISKLEEDEYIQATKDYIKDLLVQNGKHGNYKIYVGEYTIGSSPNEFCISAAVSGGGEEEYYVRYLGVKLQSGQYHFWLTGFGLNGSLEECSADRHYMNRLCIERTKQLGRSEFEISV